MPLHEEAFRRAQEKAAELFAYLQFTPDADKSNIGEKCGRALIAAYLGDPDVRSTIATTTMLYRDGLAGSGIVAAALLQAIGAGVAP